MNPCGCHWDQKRGIVYCHVHGAAPTLLEACRVALDSMTWATVARNGSVAEMLRAAIERASAGEVVT